MALETEEVQNASLAELGVILMDSVDGAIERGDYEGINEAYQGIGQEIVRRVPDPVKIRHLMDFHYKKWSDLQAKGTSSRQEETELQNSFYEFRAMMTGFVESAPNGEDDGELVSTLHGRS